MKSPRQLRIESAIERTEDKKLLALLSRAWWKEFFAKGISHEPHRKNPLSLDQNDRIRS